MTQVKHADALFKRPSDLAGRHTVPCSPCPSYLKDTSHWHMAPYCYRVWVRPFLETRRSFEGSCLSLEDKGKGDQIEVPLQEVYTEKTYIEASREWPGGDSRDLIWLFRVAD